MTKTVIVYDTVEETVKDILDNKLKIDVRMKFKYSDWDYNIYNPNTKIEFSLSFLEKTLNKIMEEKGVPVRFKLEV